MDKKAQAFSVFELLIAGVVAFAILIILLALLVPPKLPGKTPVDSISTAIKVVGSSGETLAETFVINKNQEVTSSDIAFKSSLDKRSIFFVPGVFGDDSRVVVGGSGTEVASFRYVGAENEMNMGARVICKVLAEELDQSLDGLADSSQKYTMGIKAVDYCGDSTPCCAVIFERS